MRNPVTRSVLFTLALCAIPALCPQAAGARPGTGPREKINL